MGGSVSFRENCMGESVLLSAAHVIRKGNKAEKNAVYKLYVLEVGTRE